MLGKVDGIHTLYLKAVRIRPRDGSKDPRMCLRFESQQQLFLLFEIVPVFVISSPKQHM